MNPSIAKVPGLASEPECRHESSIEDRRRGTPAPTTSESREPVELAARLLCTEHDADHVLARIAWGVAGLVALGALPPFALAYQEESCRAHSTAFDLVQQTLCLPAAAALTLTFSLPGLFILLGMLSEQPDLKRMLHAVSRAYYRIGLLALGVAPVLALYAFTGASANWVFGVATGCYFAAGATGVAVLLRDFFGQLNRKRGRSALLIAAWGCFVALLGLYFFVKLNPHV